MRVQRSTARSRVRHNLERDAARRDRPRRRASGVGGSRRRFCRRERLRSCSSSAARVDDFKQIPRDDEAQRRRDGLGVELHAVSWQRLVLDSLDLAVLGARDDVKGVAGRSARRERVVASGLEALREPLEQDRFLFVEDAVDDAVPRLGQAFHGEAVEQRHALVPEADSQDDQVLRRRSQSEPRRRVLKVGRNRRMPGPRREHEDVDVA
mmetsp:Transcript_29892/g.100718  ORF Transcript_29892/g.100718 Transcript_29892/m.100718 type:complete len:209 (+) Transcript_29892:513-1139(+)